MPPFRLLLAAVLVLHGILHGQTRHISADAAHPAGPHSGVPLFCVGAGRASEALYPEWQAQLTTLQNEIGFHYLRFHGILSDEMGLYKEDAAGNPVYDFTKVDQVYDILLTRHIKPFVELTFMPKALASGTRTIFWYSANVTPPKDMRKWESLIRTLTAHWIARYGLPEVESWYFEVWNEPDYPSFFNGTIQQYFDLYRATATALKEVCPACRVGGPATSNPSDTRFLTFLNASNTPIDFYSTHTYGVLKLGLTPGATSAPPSTPHPTPSPATFAPCASRSLTPPTPGSPSTSPSGAPPTFPTTSFTTSTAPRPSSLTTFDADLFTPPPCPTGSSPTSSKNAVPRPAPFTAVSASSTSKASANQPSSPTSTSPS